MNELFSQYTTDYISGVMSLRKPQQKSLEILDHIMKSVEVKKDMNLDESLKIIHELYPICSDFEREFLSLTFALATGVGKTRLMGAFIAYLYTNHNIKNFFVVAPNTTIYEKLKRDLSIPTDPKYVFQGLGCFNTQPAIITDDDYRTKTIAELESDVRIFIFNIDKFNKENSNMKKINEMLGDSFYQYLANLPDLVLIMDESHHYRAKRGMQAINELNPVLGLELTATPLITSGSKQVPFKNVVYEYPLSMAIADGYTRTPFAGTRTDINFYNLTQEEIDKMMIIDGVKLHERAKRELEAYAINNSTENKTIRKVKPFMMVVCKDTDHANWVESFIKSDELSNGKYKNKTIIVHSNQRGAESEKNMRLLLDVEKYDNPVEIVIHVNMLKEGWDVNNLYTIVPLRTASSKVLREQMVGRGLRLPYGVRTGDEIIDAVYLTAHDKFQDIINEAQKGDSIFKAGNVIKIEEIEPNFLTSEVDIDITADDIINDFPIPYGFKTEDSDEVQDNKIIECNIGRKTQILEKVEQSKEFINKTMEIVKEEVFDEIQENKEFTPERKIKIVEKTKEKLVKETLGENISMDEILNEDNQFTNQVLNTLVDTVHEKFVEKFIPIPRLEIIDRGEEEYHFIDFDIDLSEFNHVAVKNDLLIQNLENLQDLQRIEGDKIDYIGYEPKREILKILREKPEIDYEKTSKLLFKLISQVVNHYEEKYDSASMLNIVMMNKKDIANKIYRQMMSEEHFYSGNSFVEYSVNGFKNYNSSQSYSYENKINLFENYQDNIKRIVFDGLKKSVFSPVKFDSLPELIFARILEKDDDIINWLRPAQNEFNIVYNRGRHYVPDFVVETKSNCFIVEVKGEDKINTPDVLAKKEKSIEYCKIVNAWAKENNQKEWQYIFIPSKEIQANSTFSGLLERFGII